MFDVDILEEVMEQIIADQKIVPPTKDLRWGRVGDDRFDRNSQK